MAKALGGQPCRSTRPPTKRIGAVMPFISWPLGCRKYEDPRWMTYKQAAENGWQVRKGEKGTHIEFWEVKGARSNENKARTAATNPRRKIKPPHSSGLHRLQREANRGCSGISQQPTAFEAVQGGEHILANSGAKITTTSATVRSIVRPPTASTCLRKKLSKTRLVIMERRFTNSRTGRVMPHGSIARP